MKVEQRTWKESTGWLPAKPGDLGQSAQLVLAFGAPNAIRRPELSAQIREFYPLAQIMGCSTSGEIQGAHVLDGSFAITAIEFEHTLLRSAYITLEENTDSLAAGEALAQLLPETIPGKEPGTEEKLVNVLVFSEGLQINASDLVAGLTKRLPPGVIVTGGLAGDNLVFGETLVFRESKPEKRTAAALGLYGNRLEIGAGSCGGWDSFGVERVITRAQGNVLYELDGRPALALYKQYLGEHAKGLPATALFFPLSVRSKDSKYAAARTFLAFNEQEQSMTFSGSISQGGYARLMKYNVTKVIEGAGDAARRTCTYGQKELPQLAILISCVARKLVLKQRVEEEVEEAQNVMGNNTIMTGFYSYGEIAPFELGSPCLLHNQTMTITTISER